MNITNYYRFKLKSKIRKVNLNSFKDYYIDLIGI
jgi:hypothetical protein